MKLAWTQNKCGLFFITAIVVQISVCSLLAYAEGGDDTAPPHNSNEKLVQVSSSETLPPSYFSNETFYIDTDVLIDENLPDQIPNDMRDPILDRVIEKLTSSNPGQNGLSKLGPTGFTNIEYLWKQLGDEDVYKDALREIADMFKRSSLICIDLLELSEYLRISSLTVERKSFQESKRASFLIIAQKFQELLRQFSIGNEKLIQLIQTCTTYECATEISKAQSDLIQYGRFINKEKHVFNNDRTHPLIRRALEELYSKVHDYTPSSMYRNTFNLVLEVFRSDVDPLFDHTVEMQTRKITNYKSHLRSVLNSLSFFNINRMPHISDPVIESELVYVDEVRRDTISHIQKGTSLNSFKRKPKYHRHTLVCNGHSAPGQAHGLHLILAGFIDLRCKSLQGRYVDISIWSVGPGMYTDMKTVGIVTIDSLSPVTPYGTWIGVQAGIGGLVAGARVLTSIGKDGSVLQGAFLEVSTGVLGTISKITVTRP